jgi:hypothetical protein
MRALRFQSSTGVVLAVVVTFGAAFSPSIGHADCKEWELHEFELIQTNGLFARVYPAKQSPGQFGGGATSYYRDSEGVYVPVPGRVEGSISGDDVLFSIHWNTGPVGEYTGHISGDGLLDGETRDRLNPESTARWSQRPYGDEPTIKPAAKCVDVATPLLPRPGATPAPPPPAPASPLEQSGVLKNRPGAGDISTQTKPTPPPPPPPQVTVLLDVDVCASPAGCDDKTRLGVLPAGQEGVTLVERQDPEYHVKWPGPEGWVYSGPGYESLKLP